mmetsp:Transcript_27499/g.92379  ORF Transcript_27499/g.92379 Transcript_27499/m.92379 type:complete len:244 (+) Transcript_27499:201-932(+)
MWTSTCSGTRSAASGSRANANSGEISLPCFLESSPHSTSNWTESWPTSLILSSSVDANLFRVTNSSTNRTKQIKSLKSPRSPVYALRCALRHSSLAWTRSMTSASKAVASAFQLATRGHARSTTSTRLVWSALNELKIRSSSRIPGVMPASLRASASSPSLCVRCKRSHLSYASSASSSYSSPRAPIRRVRRASAKCALSSSRFKRSVSSSSTSSRGHSVPNPKPRTPLTSFFMASLFDRRCS